MEGCQDAQGPGAQCYMKKDYRNWICSALRNEGAREIGSLFTNIWWEGVKKTEPDSSEKHTVRGQEATGTSWRQGH